MNTERIKEIQQATAYPNSKSVQQALLQVWHECSQEQIKQITHAGKQSQTMYVRCKSEFSDASLILPFTHDKSILNGMPLPVQEIKNVYIFTPEELEVLLQKERREAAEKAWLNGFKQSAEGFNGEYPFEGDSDETILRDPLISELVKLFLETNYPLPQPPKP